MPTANIPPEEENAMQKAQPAVRRCTVEVFTVDRPGSPLSLRVRYQPGSFAAFIPSIPSPPVLAHRPKPIAAKPEKEEDTPPEKRTLTKAESKQRERTRREPKPRVALRHPTPAYCT